MASELTEDSGGNDEGLVGPDSFHLDSVGEEEESEEEQMDPECQQLSVWLVLATEIGFCDHGTFFEEDHYEETKSGAKPFLS